MKAYAAPIGNSREDVEELRRLLLETGGRIFRVVFVSRGKNEPRDMRARLKRLSHGWHWNDRRNLQFTVWDVQKKEWRVVPLERVAVFRCGSLEWVTKVGGQT